MNVPDVANHILSFLSAKDLAVCKRLGKQHLLSLSTALEKRRKKGLAEIVRIYDNPVNYKLSTQELWELVKPHFYVLKKKEEEEKERSETTLHAIRYYYAKHFIKGRKEFVYMKLKESFVLSVMMELYH